MLTRLFLPFLLITLISSQSDEFLRLKQELEDRIAALRPEAREVANKLKAVFEARLPKEEAKNRLNAVLESASDSAKAALDALKPSEKIDAEVVIALPEEVETIADDACRVAERTIALLRLPGLDDFAEAAQRLNLTGETLAEALDDPELTSELGISDEMLTRLETVATERGLINNTVENMLHTLRYNISLILTPDERSILERCVSRRNLTSIADLFNQPRNARFGRPGGKWNDTRQFWDDFMGGEFNRSGRFDGQMFGRMRNRFGNDSAWAEAAWANFTGDFAAFSNVSEQSMRAFLGNFKDGGNSSFLERFFNGSTDGNGTFAKIREAFHNGNSSFLGGLFSSSSNGNGMFSRIRDAFQNGNSSSNSSFLGGIFEGSSSGNGTLSKIRESFQNGNSSFLGGFFNGSSNGNGTLAKVREAFKTGNLSSITGGGGAFNNGTALANIKNLFNGTLPALNSSSSTGNSSLSDKLSTFGSSLNNIPSSVKNLFGN